MLFLGLEEWEEEDRVGIAALQRGAFESRPKSSSVAHVAKSNRNVTGDVRYVCVVHFLKCPTP